MVLSGRQTIFSFCSFTLPTLPEFFIALVMIIPLSSQRTSLHLKALTSPDLIPEETKRQVRVRYFLSLQMASASSSLMGKRFTILSIDRDLLSLSAFFDSGSTCWMGLMLMMPCLTASFITCFMVTVMPLWVELER